MKAAKLAPEALLLPADFDEYRRYSRLFKEAVRAVAPHIEDRGIDEIYIDLTDLVAGRRGGRRARPVGARAGGRDGHTARRARGDGAFLLDRRHAQQAALQDRVRARQARRPDRASPRRTSRARIWPLAGAQGERHRPQGGRAARGARHRHDRRAGAGRAGCCCVREFGESYGAWMHEAAHGRDERGVVTYREAKSVSRETTFEHDLHPVRDRERLSRIFTDLCVRVGRRPGAKGLRRQDHRAQAALRQLQDRHPRPHARSRPPATPPPSAAPPASA